MIDGEVLGPPTVALNKNGEGTFVERLIPAGDAHVTFDPFHVNNCPTAVPDVIFARGRVPKVRLMIGVVPEFVTVPPIKLGRVPSETFVTVPDPTLPGGI